MVTLLRVIACIAVLNIIYTILFPYIKTLSEKRKKRAKDFLKESKKNKRKEKINYYKDVVVTNLSNRHILSELKKEEFTIMLKRLDLKMSPYEIRLRQLLYVLLAFICGFFMLKLNLILGYITFMFVIIGWYYPIDELEKKVEKKNNNILKDFPSFYSMVYYQYSKSVSIYLSDVIRDFLPNANKDMAEELGVVLDNSEYGEEFALRQFKKRVPLRFIFKFCDIMETRLRGYDNTAQMSYLKNELDEHRVSGLEEELKKREDKNKRVQLVLLGILAIYIIVYYYYQFTSAFKLFE